MSEETPSGRLQEDIVRLGPEALSDLYEQGYFGRPRGKGLELSLVEAAYLLDRSRIKVFSDGRELDFKAFFQAASSLEKGFEFRYVVYKDLRERGYYVQPGRPDFRVYPRGGHPGKTPAEFYVLVISERMPLPLKEIIEPVRVAGQMRKKLMLAIVDEESDITFYEAREKSMAGKMTEEEPGGMATLLEDRVVLWDPEVSKRLHEHGFYGKPIGERLQLSLVESAYLLERGLIQLVDRSGEPMNLDGLKDKARKIESDFDLKYKVYRDLRDHKLVVKTGFKFGTHFRVYKQVESLAKVPHSEYLVHTVPDDHVFMPPVLSRAVRLAHSVRKQMLFAYPDEDVRYLEIRRLKP
ncbi:MAG TPA: tRNA-intron lyase [Methanotrichaceae archaeon]|nr:tRNA-intron lyase [Methanotrichaceae archaeon]